MESGVSKAERRRRREAEEMLYERGRYQEGDNTYELVSVRDDDDDDDVYLSNFSAEDEAGTSRFERLGTSVSELPGTSRPELPGISGSELPGTSGSELPGTSGSELPETSGSELPGTSVSELPGTSGSELPGTSRSVPPGTSGSELPGTSGSELPGTSVSALPGTSGSEHPGTSGSELPGTSGSELPGTSGSEALALTPENVSCSASVDRRTFYRLSTQGTSGMFRDGDLSVMYGASQGLGIEEVVIGLSENSADLPELRAGQRRLTPVLICMPHNAALSSSLSINLPVPPHTGAITVLYRPASDTQQQQQAGGEWRPVDDVTCFIHEDSISLVLTHFSEYCVIEDEHLCRHCTMKDTQPPPPPSLLRRFKSVFLSCTASKKKSRVDPLPQPSLQPPLHRFVSVFLIGKRLEKPCVEVTVLCSESSDAAPRAELRGTLVKQEKIALVNDRPITITMEPAEGWTVREDDKEKVFFFADLTKDDSHTFNLRGDAAACNDVEFDVQLLQCKGRKFTLYVWESYRNLIGESPCGSRAAQDDVGRQNNPSNPLDDDNNSPTTSQSADVSHVPVTASRSQHLPGGAQQTISQLPGGAQQTISQPRKRSLNCQDQDDHTNPPDVRARSHPVAPGIMREPSADGLVSEKAVRGSNETNVCNQSEMNNYDISAQEIISKLEAGSLPKWPISYEKCAKVADQLDLNDWKMLARNLNFDADINRIQWQANQLREWMQQNKEEDPQVLKERLKTALQELGRQDIIDEMDALDNDHVDE